MMASWPDMMPPSAFVPRLVIGGVREEVKAGD